MEYLAKSTDFCANSTIFSLDLGLRAFAMLSLHVLSIKAELAFFFFFLDVLGLCCCTGFCLVAESRGYSLVVVHRFLTAVASPILEHGP